MTNHHLNHERFVRKKLFFIFQTISYGFELYEDTQSVLLVTVEINAWLISYCALRLLRDLLHIVEYTHYHLMSDI